MGKYFTLHIFICISLISTVEMGFDMGKIGPIFNLADGRNIYQQWIQKYKRRFADKQDYETRYRNFLETLRAINEINSQGGGTKVGPSSTADLSEYERLQLSMQRTTVAPDPDLLHAGGAGGDEPVRYQLGDMFNVM